MLLYWLMLLLHWNKSKCWMVNNTLSWIHPYSVNFLLLSMSVWNGLRFFSLISCANMILRIKQKLKCKYLQLFRVIDKTIPRLSHINPAVVFGCIKLICRYLDYLKNEELIKNLIKKLAPSIVSVVSFTP